MCSWNEIYYFKSSFMYVLEIFELTFFSKNHKSYVKRVQYMISMRFLKLNLDYTGNDISHSIPVGSKKIKKDRNRGIGKDRTVLSLTTYHFASPKLYLFLSSHLSRLSGNIYFFLSLCLVIFIFFYPLVYPSTEVVSIFSYLFLYLS